MIANFYENLSEKKKTVIGYGLMIILFVVLLLFAKYQLDSQILNKTNQVPLGKKVKGTITLTAKSSNDDNTLVPSKEPGFDYENKSNTFKVYFTKKSADTFFRGRMSGYSLDWSLQEANNVTGDVKNNTITYKNILNNMDLKYTMNQKLKEEFIIKEPGTDKVTMELKNLKGIEYVKTPEGEEFFKVTGKDEKIWEIEKPFMVDAKGAKSENIKMVVRNQDNKVYLELNMDKDWLMSNERSYPITLDPSLKPIKKYKNLDINTGQDTFISTKQVDDGQYYDNVLLRAGYDPYHHITQSFIQFNLNNLPKDARADKAYLSLYQLRVTNGAAQTINVHRVKLPWNEKTLDQNLYDSDAINAKGGFRGGKIASITKPGKPNENSMDEQWKFDLKGMVDNWLKGVDKNYGVQIVPNSSDQYELQFWSMNYKEHPELAPSLSVEYYYYVPAAPLIDGIAIDRDNGTVFIRGRAEAGY